MRPWQWHMGTNQLLFSSHRKPDKFFFFFNLLILPSTPPQFLTFFFLFNDVVFIFFIFLCVPLASMCEGWKWKRDQFHCRDALSCSRGNFWLVSIYICSLIIKICVEAGLTALFGWWCSFLEEVLRVYLVHLDRWLTGFAGLFKWKFPTVWH